MIRNLIGIFLVLHGLVHVLYFGQSARYFELQPGMDWPDYSWAFSNILGMDTNRKLAGISLILAALLFVVGGAGLLFKQVWWRPIIIAGSIFSTLIFFLFWNGRFEHLDNSGWIGILINLVLLAALYLKWLTI
ncbi:hypothetical protein [Pelolinea submarina]|uniref:DoxX-like protein n=1 Tax=Pelolinea submarina TaxID=913107 RepID=A0A347ZT06_9CHLR|nr:hypothetical protein [Pelolinea submarina]REG10988.1 hypothetical protein DFR64_0860 [Pelolinea submarina]BBB48437.1 hypothetical protein Pelsub_P1665 [Pelolinea submarina]